jgi:hypothetical protein
VETRGDPLLTLHGRCIRRRQLVLAMQILMQVLAVKVLAVQVLLQILWQELLLLD